MNNQDGLHSVQAGAATVREREQTRAVEVIGLSHESVRELSRRKAEPAWMLQKRLEAWEVFQQLPMPTMTTEGWRRTDLRGLKLDQVEAVSDAALSPPSTRALPTAMRRAGLPEDTSARLVQVNGGPASAELSDQLKGEGVILVGMDEALQRYPELVQERFMSAVRVDEHKFTALHAALWSGGSVLYVPPGVSIELPIQSLYWYSEERLGAFGHTLIVLEPEAEVTFVESFGSATTSNQAVASRVVEIFAKPRSRLRYSNLNEAGPERWTFAVTRALVERDSSLNCLVVATGGQVTKAWVEARLMGTGAEVDLRGLLFGNGRQQFDHYTQQDHEASHTRSDLNYKAVLQDKASSNYAGMVRIGKEARQCNANQENRNLLLSSGAKADSDPKLEILNSDVIRAGHGATVGPVDPEQLYYLMTRGFSREAAEDLLVEAFFEPILSKVPLAGLRRRIWSSIERKLRKENG